MTWRNLAPAVALAGVLAAGCSSSTSSDAAHGVSAAPSPTGAAQVAAHGVEAAIATIPWSQVGPGWMLATWSPGPGGRPGAARPPGFAAPRAARHDALPGRPRGRSLSDHHLPAAGPAGQPGVGRLVRRWRPRPVRRAVRHTAEGDHGRSAHRRTDDVAGAGVAPLQPPEWQSAAVVRAARPRLQTRDARSCRSRRPTRAHLPDRQARQRVQWELSFDARRDAARAGHLGGPGADGQRRNSRADAADSGSDQLQPAAVVGRKYPRDRSRGLRCARVHVAAVAGAGYPGSTPRAHRRPPQAGEAPPAG